MELSTSFLFLKKRIEQQQHQPESVVDADDPYPSTSTL